MKLFAPNGWYDDKEIFSEFKERILGCNLIEVFAEFSNIDLILICLNKLLGGSPLTVIWRLDEIQNVDRGKGFSKHESKMYQYVSKLMGLTLDFTSGNFIIPIINGTTNATIKGDLPGSTFKINSVSLFISDFSVDDALRMVNEKILVEETKEDLLRHLVQFQD
jgi:hypothetical protein